MEEDLKKLWEGLDSVLIDEDPDGSVVIANDYHIWRKGTCLFAIWHWFDEKLPEGLAKHLHG